MDIHIPELLAPAGNFDKLVTAIHYGADAVYLGGEKYSLRARAGNFDESGIKQAVQYQEGRKVRNSRRARAMGKKTRYGQKEQEDAWLNAEVDALYRLAGAGVRVPEPFGFVDGVLLMEMIADEDGKAAPRLDDVTLTPEQARDYHSKVIAEMSPSVSRNFLPSA